MAGKSTTFWVAIKLGKRRVMPDTPDGRLLVLVETAKAHMRAKVEHQFRGIKQQFGFPKTKVRGMVKTIAKSMFWQR
jgi:IS5 family transposase